MKIFFTNLFSFILPASVVILVPLSNEKNISIYNTQDLQDMFWGGYYGSCTDKYGVQWMFNFENK